MNPEARVGDVYKSSTGRHVRIIRIKHGMPFHVGGKVAGFQDSRATIIEVSRTGKRKKAKRSYDREPFHSVLRGNAMAPGYQFITNTKTDRTQEIDMATKKTTKTTSKKTASKKTSAKKTAAAKTAKKVANARKSPPKKATSKRYSDGIPALNDKWEFRGLHCLTIKQLQARYKELTGKATSSESHHTLAYRISKFVKANAPKSKLNAWKKLGLV